MNDGDGKKKGIHVVGHSKPFSIQVQDPKAKVIVLSPGLYEVPQSSLMDVNIVFDFTDKVPPYGVSDNWWSFNEETKTVHVLMSEEMRKRYVDLMDKRMAGSELTRDEEIEIEDAEVIMQTVPRSAAEKALMKYYELLKQNIGTEAEPNQGEQNKPDDSSKKEYRTRARAGDVVDMPEKYAIITQQQYQNAMGLFQEGNAYLQPLDTVDGLEYKDGKLYFRGLPASEAELKQYYSDEVPELIDLPLLRVFYSIVLNTFLRNLKDGKPQTPTLSVYLPDLFAFWGRRNINREQTVELIDLIMSYHTLVGVVDGNILPVLLYVGEDREKNTLSFMSPYMNRVIEKIYKVSIRTDKNGKPKLKKNGEPQTLPVYSYLIKPTIKGERNQKAVEIVHIVTTLIERAGDNEPHISAKTIVERNMQLRYSLQGATPANQNTMLKRAFTKAWELLRKQTDLEKVYPGIELPDPKDPKNIPTMSQLEKTIFTFKHNGKHKKSE